MVKNATGGNNKNLARKNVAPSGRMTSKLRTADEVGEIYAVITKVLGGGMCNVQCIDSKDRLCIVRGKFKGRGKRDNTLSAGTWVLIGAREWESEKDTAITAKLNKCDLLEVYSEIDKKNLRSNVNANWPALNFGDGSCVTKDDDVQFDADSSAFDHQQLMATLAKNGAQAHISLNLTKEDDGDESEIDVDAI